MRVVIKLLAVLCAVSPLALFGQANGKLQIHFMDVGQGDGAILISPLGETVLFDNGVRNDCDKPVSYLQQLGVTKIDYHIASHYHDDHIGCTAQVLDEFPLIKIAFDRGGTYHTGTYRNYVAKVGTKRRAVTVGQRVTLDAGSPNPVHIEFLALNGAGVVTTNENDLSVVALVRFGDFDAEIAGDLSGYKENAYEDIESVIAARVAQVELYKVHHHGSRYSSNAAWLAAIRPRVGIISAGVANKHGHPTDETVERLHVAGVHLYWTTEGGAAEPEPSLDTVGGNIIVEVAASAARTFTVRHTAGSQVVDEYAMWNAAPAVPPTTTAFAWSRRPSSKLYHHASCRFVANISPENLITGTTVPGNKTLHTDCPK
jgi:beta-lactamase superfamily II metal-dependent hydrolase